MYKKPVNTSWYPKYKYITGECYSIKAPNEIRDRESLIFLVSLALLWSHLVQIRWNMLKKYEREKCTIVHQLFESCVVYQLWRYSVYTIHHDINVMRVCSIFLKYKAYKVYLDIGYLHVIIGWNLSIPRNWLKK